MSRLIQTFRALRHSIPSPPPRPLPSRSTVLSTLETLPDEILDAIFRHLDGYILPPLSKRLLPFHRSQLYRHVTLDGHRYKAFKKTIKPNAGLRNHVESLSFEFRLIRCDRSRRPWRKTHAPRSFVSSFPNLKEVRQRVDSLEIDNVYPRVSDFYTNPKLEKVLVRSWQGAGESKGTASDYDSRALDWSTIRQRSELTWVEEEDDRDDLYADDYDYPEVTVELTKFRRGTFGLRYFAKGTNDPHVYHLLRSLPLTQVTIVAFSHQVHLDRLLSNIGYPTLLGHLALFSWDLNRTTINRDPKFFLRFPNLVHLALGGTALPRSLEFYHSLHQLPLQSLFIGPEAPVNVQRIIDLLAGPTRLRIATLKRLVLENIEARAPPPDQEDTAHLDAWTLPKWTADCTRDKVVELGGLATALGIQIGGSTFRGLGINQSEAYRAARSRWLDDNPEESGDSDDGADEDENPLLRDPIQFHGQFCGCRKNWWQCRRFTEEMGRLAREG